MKGDKMSLFCNFKNLSNSEKLYLHQELKQDEEKSQYFQIGFKCDEGEFYIQYYKNINYLVFNNTVTNIKRFQNFKRIASAASNAQKILKKIVLDFVLNNKFEMTDDSDICNKKEFISILKKE